MAPLHCDGPAQCTLLATAPFLEPLLFFHPDAPRDSSRFVVAYGTVRQFEGELDLAVMVAFVPNHVLQQEDRMIVVKVHAAPPLDPALYGIPYHLGALIQHSCNAIAVKLNCPLLLRHVHGELGRVLKNEYKPYGVDVCEDLCNRRAALDCLCLQPTFGKSAEKANEYGIVPVPGIQQSL